MLFDFLKQNRDILIKHMQLEDILVQVTFNKDIYIQDKNDKDIIFQYGTVSNTIINIKRKIKRYNPNIYKIKVKSILE